MTSNLRDCARPVLIVEDDDELRRSITEVLADEAYPWIEAPNGAEALTALRGGATPCVILLDLMMPVMDGWQFRRALLEDERLAGLPVVVLSAHADLPRAAATLQASAHLKKPLELTRLLEVIAAHCDVL